MSLGIPWSPFLLLLAVLTGFAIAVIEGVSPHGWDNFSLQIAASGITWWLFN
jgi:nitrogen regulatory protein PII-like uncharacterized protein